MTPPSIDNIRADNELLDALGARRGGAGDELGDLLQAWVDDIDGAPAAAPVSRGRRRHALRFGAGSALVVGALSVSGVAAAMTDTQIPVLRELAVVAQGFGVGRTTPALSQPPMVPTQATSGSTAWIDASSSVRTPATTVPSPLRRVSPSTTAATALPPVVPTRHTTPTATKSPTPTRSPSSSPSSTTSGSSTSSPSSPSTTTPSTSTSSGSATSTPQPTPTTTRTRPIAPSFGTPSPPAPASSSVLTPSSTPTVPPTP